MKRFKARVAVTLKEGLLDPQGEAAAMALKDMGFDQAEQVRIGKVVDIELEAEDAEKALDDLRGMCEQLLVNPVTERSKVLALEEDAG